MHSLATPEILTSGDRCFDEGLQAAREQFDRQPFLFRHFLSEHPLFQIPRLVEVVLSRPDSESYYDQGDAEIGQRWNAMPPKTMSLEQAVRRIQEAKAWIALKHAEQDPAYRELLDRALSEILPGSWLERYVKSREVIIFVSSPDRVTTYHIDRECNFLLQITGDKLIYVFDRNDRQVLSEEEIELFWSQDNNSARYRPDIQDHAQIFHLTPGTGLHIPVNFPHWVRNGKSVSVSVSINFQFHDRFRANIYRMNYMMRRLGLNPVPPGRTPWKDSLKATVATPVVELRRMARRLK